MQDPETINAAIASNVRALRSQRGLTLDVLAARSSVSKGMLVQVEQGRTNPSVSTLTRIASALGVTVARLVEVAEAPAIRVVEAHEMVTFTQGGDAARLLVGADAPLILELWDWRLGPGDHHDGDAHTPGTRELLTVLAGTLTLTVNGKSHVVNADDAALFSADRPHRYANEGADEVRFILAVAEPVAVQDQ